MVNDFESDNCGEDESTTFRVNVDDPRVLGVPERMPALLKLKPAGNDPERTLHEYGVTPPAALNVAAYAVPVVPSGSDEVVIVTGRTVVEIVIVNDLVAFCFGEDES